MEAIRKWTRLLSRQTFTLVTDQRSVAFMLDSRRRFKIKTEKIQEWRVELDSLSYSDMCNPQPAALFGAARLFSFMILKWYFK